MSLHRLLLLLLFAAPSSVGAEEQQLLSLDGAVRRALESAPQVSAQTANLEAMQALTLSAGRLPDPELVIGIDNLPVTGSDAYSATSDFMTMRKVGVMQEFPAGAKRKLQREVAEAQAGVASAELTESRLVTAQQVAQAWVRRAAAEAALKDLQSLQPEVELQATAARAALASGRSSTAEALAAEAAVAQLRNRLLRMQSETRQATAELARWLGSDATLPLAQMPSFDDLPTPPAALLAAVHEHGSLLPFESQLEAARLEVDLAEGVKAALAAREHHLDVLHFDEVVHGRVLFSGRRS